MQSVDKQGFQKENGKEKVIQKSLKKKSKSEQQACASGKGPPEAACAEGKAQLEARRSTPTPGKKNSFQASLAVTQGTKDMRWNGDPRPSSIIEATEWPVSSELGEKTVSPKFLIHPDDN